MGACIKMFVVANCLGGVIEAGIQVEMYFHTKKICIHSECRISVGSLRYR